MNGKKSQMPLSTQMTKKRITVIGIIATIAVFLGYLGFSSMVPANGSVPVLGPAANHFIKATHSSHSGYAYVSQSSGSAKGVRSSGGGLLDPTYTFHKGELQSIHFINEDYDTHAMHNFNIDEFNVHSRDLRYFETQTLTFVADSTGNFGYYCTIHPEMKGEIVVE